MNIKHKKLLILHSLHNFYLRYRYAAVGLFFLILFLAINQAPKVLGNSTIAGVETPVKIYFDNHNKSFMTTQNTVEGAIDQAGVPLKKNDITEPPLDTILNGKDITFKVIRALPVLISDNNQEHLAYSAYTDEDDILKQLKIEIYPEDKVSSELITDPVDENAIGQKIIIERAPIFTVYADGKQETIRSWGKSISEVVANKINLGQRDIIEPALTVSSAGVSEIIVTRVNVAEIEESLIIPFGSQSRKDFNLYTGQTKVTQVGENGENKQLVRVTYFNGAEIDRVVLSYEVIKPVVTEVISTGVKPYNSGMWWETIVGAGNTWGIDPVGIYNVMICESGGNPYSGNYYKGLFQYNPDTWSGASNAYPGGTYKGAPITDGTAQIYVTAWKVAKSGWSAWGCKP